MSAIVREVERSKEKFIQEHQRKYDKPTLPPAWKTLELLSFGTLSKLYFNFSKRKTKNRVAHAFNIPNYAVLESWMRSVTLLRNYCAHHVRLWNRNFTIAPKMHTKMQGKWIVCTQPCNYANKFYAVCCCVAYWLDAIGYGDTFKCELQLLLLAYPQVDVKAMGFPESWQDNPLWRHCVTLAKLVAEVFCQVVEDFGHVAEDFCHMAEDVGQRLGWSVLLGG